MKENITVKLISLFLLMIFFIGATPRIYFHDVLASHTDHQFSKTRSSEKHLQQHQFNCGFNTVEAITPFDFPGFFIEISGASTGTVYLQSNYHFSPAYRSFYFCLRGPPVA